jgi:hypothetical protein
MQVTDSRKNMRSFIHFYIVSYGFNYVAVKETVELGGVNDKRKAVPNVGTVVA